MASIGCAFKFPIFFRPDPQVRILRGTGSEKVSELEKRVEILERRVEILEYKLNALINFIYRRK